MPLNLVVPDYQSIDAILLAMLTALVGFAIPAFSQDKPANNLEIIHGKLKAEKSSCRILDLSSGRLGEFALSIVCFSMW